MGDTGSLALGGFVAGSAYMLRMPWIILVVGLIYLIEVLSVIIQVTYFKKTGGKRFFKMAPIHHILSFAAGPRQGSLPYFPLLPCCSASQGFCLFDKLRRT